MKISVLIPFRPDSRARSEIWWWLRQRYEQLLPAAEIIASDDGTRDPRKFNHGQAVNRAAAQATGDLYVIGDADTAFNITTLDLAIRHIAEFGGWAVPQTYHQLTMSATEELLGRSPDCEIDEPGTGDVIWTGEGSSVAPIQIVPAKAFHLVGGHDERYADWGSTDRSFSVSMNTLYQPYSRWPGAVYHLWHPRRETHDSGAALTKLYIEAEGDEQAIKLLREGHR